MTTNPPQQPQQQVGYCNQCGTMNALTSNFCAKCGVRLPWASQTLPTSPAAPTVAAGTAAAPTRPVQLVPPAAAPQVQPMLQAPAPADEPAGCALLLISFLFPYIGVIIWIVLLTGPYRRKAAHVGWATFAGFLIGFFLLVLLIPLLAAIGAGMSGG